MRGPESYTRNVEARRARIKARGHQDALERSRGVSPSAPDVRVKRPAGVCPCCDDARVVHTPDGKVTCPLCGGGAA